MHGLKIITALYICLTFFAGCSVEKAPKDNLNTYLPPSFSSLEEKSPSPIELEQSLDSSFWDLSDVDTSYVDHERKLIAFTFDDGPSKTMENILAVFADYNEQNPDCMATATFFLNGVHITDESLPLLHTAHILNCELGNHTHRHLNLTTLTQEDLQKEIRETDKILSRIDGKPFHLLRPPFGAINGEIKASLQVPVINWTIDTLDWTGKNSDEIYHSVFSARFSGAIVLMHDGYLATVEALKRLLPDLKADGYQVVSVSALAKVHGCTLYNGKEYIRARKQ